MTSVTQLLTVNENFN